MTYTSPCLSEPCRRLSDYRLALIAERLQLLTRQLAAKNEAAECARRIADIEARLQLIDGGVR